MDNIQLFIKQVTGEIDVVAIIKEKSMPPEDIVKEYYTGLREDGTAYFNITNSPHRKTNFKPNIRVIFDRKTWKIKSAELVEVGQYRSKHE
jgi:hypothetical protein